MIFSTGRRKFLQSGFLAGQGLLFSSLLPAKSQPIVDSKKEARLKLSLNAYSFNKPLTSAETDLLELIDYCAEMGIAAIDPTAYYFPGYPEVPPDDYLFEFKRKAAINGLEISGTGIRNDFSTSDKKSRDADIDVISKWTIAASKIGAPLIRVFAGRSIPEDHSKQEVMKWMIEDFKTCAAIGKANGVMMAMQNHNDFIKNSDEIIQIMTAVNSPWFGLHLDIGSFGERDPYEEIQKVLPYALTFQIKENVIMNGQQVPANLDRLFGMITSSGFRGYLPLETLGENAAGRFPAFYNSARAALLRLEN